MTKARHRRPRILIAGLGNILLQDDGVGIHAVRHLRQDAPPHTIVVEIGTAVLDALHLLSWADYILAIDAMQAGGTPGTVYRFGVDDVQQETVQTSLHELSLSAALRFLPVPHHPRIAILGVEPEIIAYGLDLSPAVAQSLPLVLTATTDIVRRWQMETRTTCPV